MDLTPCSKKTIPPHCRPILYSTPPRSTPTPKKVLGHFNGSTPAPKTPGDRFIPSRSGTNLEYSAHKISLPPRAANPPGSPSEAEKRKLVYDKLLSLEGCTADTRMLRFRPTDSASTPTKYKYWSSYSTPRDPSAKKRGRRIPRSADKVLDAPDLQNDFYLNILDWSSKNIIVIALGSCVYLLNNETGDIVNFCNFESTSTYVSSLKWNPAGKVLAIGTNSAEVQLWDTATMKLIRTFQTHDSRVSSLSWEPHGNLLSSGSQSGSIHTHDIRTPLTDHESNAHTLEVCGLSWSPTGRFLASGGNDNTVHIWDVTTRTSWDAPSQTFREHTAAVKALSWCPWQHNILATGGGTADQHLRTWNVFTGKMESAIDTGSQVSGVLWSFTHHELVSSHGLPENTLAIWNYPSLVKVASIAGHEDRILHMTMSPDGQTVATASGDETLRFWKCFMPDSQKVRDEPEVPTAELGLQRYIR